MTSPSVPTECVLLTGADGFIGRHALEILRAWGYRVVAVSRRERSAECQGDWMQTDLTDPTACRALIATVRPRWLLHLAWYTVPGSFWSSGANLRWLAAGVSLFDAFGAFGGMRAVGVGTCAEYAVGEPLFREGRTPLSPTTVYGRCKLSLANGLEAAALAHGFSWAWGRIFAPYGPGEPAEKLVTATVQALLRGERIATTEGTQLRDFLYVSDVAHALSTLLVGNVMGAVNVASGEGHSLKEVLSIIERRTSRFGLIAVGERPRLAHDPDAMVADVSRLADEVGWHPSVSLEDGISRTVAALQAATPDGDD